MKLHLRITSSNNTHTWITLFVNNANCGSLCLRTEEYVAFHSIIEKGCEGRFDSFRSSGKIWSQEEIFTAQVCTACNKPMNPMDHAICAICEECADREVARIKQEGR